MAQAALVPEALRRLQKTSLTRRKIRKVRTVRDECKHLRETLGGGKGSNERHRLAHIQFPSDDIRSDGGPGSAEIAEFLDLGTATVEKVRKQCVIEWLEATLECKVQVNRKKHFLDSNGEGRLTCWPVRIHRRAMRNGV